MLKLNPDNKILQVMSKYFDITWLTILWLVTSLPLVTLGVSSTALSSVMMGLAGDTAESGVTRAFFAVWRREWRQSLPVGLIFLGLSAVVVAELWICLAAAPAGVLGGLLWCATILFGLCVVCAGVHAFPILAKFCVTPKQFVHNLFLLVLRHPIRTAELLLLWAAALLLIYFLGFMGPLFSGPLLYAAARIHYQIFGTYIESDNLLSLRAEPSSYPH